MHNLWAQIDKLCQCLVCIGTAIHTGDVEKLLLSMAVVDDKFRTEGVLHIVGAEDLSLARQDRTGLIGGELVNDSRFLTIFRVDPSDTDDALCCRQVVDEVCFTGKGISVKLCNMEECLVSVSMDKVINTQESTEGTILVEDCEIISWV